MASLLMGIFIRLFQQNGPKKGSHDANTYVTETSRYVEPKQVTRHATPQSTSRIAQNSPACSNLSKALSDSKPMVITHTPSPYCDKDPMFSLPTFFLSLVG